MQRVLVRVTLGVDADTHEAIRTGHHGSKFGLPPAQARALIEDALARGLDVLGLHVHVGSQLADFDAQAETIVRLASFAASCRDELGWTARVADLGGGFGIRHNLDEHAPDAAVLAASAAETARLAFAEAGLPVPRGLARAGTLARRARPASPSIASAPSSGCPSGRGSPSTAACPTTRARSSTTRSTPRSPPTRADEAADGAVSVAGMHCESGDVLIDDVSLPAPRRGDLVAVPATGAYTLAMASNYNGVTRPAAVLVARRRGAADSTARDIRRPAAQRGRDDGARTRALQEAAVLAPVFRDGDGVLRIVLLLRTDRGIHGGQLGLPGGRPEPVDQGNFLATALREAEEEVGLLPSQVEVLAALDPLETMATGFRVYPFLGLVPADVDWRAATRRGRRGSSRPPSRISARRPSGGGFRSRRATSSESIEVEGIEVEGHVLWGMTLRLLDGLVPRLLAGEWDV